MVSIIGVILMIVGVSVTRSTVLWKTEDFVNAVLRALEEDRSLVVLDESQVKRCCLVVKWLFFALGLLSIAVGFNLVLSVFYWGNL